MGKQYQDRDAEDYFSEPNYDLLTDEELDELYYFGTSSSPVRQKKIKRKVNNKPLFLEESDSELDLDFDEYDDEYDD